MTALKHRDQYTESHCTRVARLAWYTGEKLGLDAEQAIRKLEDEKLLRFGADVVDALRSVVNERGNSLILDRTDIGCEL